MERGDHVNAWDILVLALVAAALVTAVRVWLKKNKRDGGCSCGCGGCTKDCALRREEKPKTNH